MLHRVSGNPSGRPRFITNPTVRLSSPMRFDRQDPAEFSPVELAVLRGLGELATVEADGVARFRYEPTRPRREVLFGGGVGAGLRDVPTCATFPTRPSQARLTCVLLSRESHDPTV